MNIDVYCDESYPDLFSSRKPSAEYLLIGSLWIKSGDRERFKAEIHHLRDRHRIGGEFKWSKVTPSRQQFYIELLKWFFNQGDNMRFRCIAVDHRQVNLDYFHEGDHELGFYKFYYQMILHWIQDSNTYHIFCDFKHNRRRDRLHTLQGCLNNSILNSKIEKVQAVRSEESVLIQLVDVLVGVTAARLNNRLVDHSAKSMVVQHLEDLLGRRIGPTSKLENKFNVFRINLQEGW